MKLEQSVSCVKNVGEKRLASLKKLGVETVKDLLTHYPRDYEDRSKICSPGDITDEGFYTVQAAIVKEAENVGFGKLVKTKLLLAGQSGSLEINWFNQPYMKNAFKKNETYVFAGDVHLAFGKFVMDAPDFEKFNGCVSASFGRIIPKYHLTQGLSQKVLRALIASVLPETIGGFQEFLPASVMEKHKLCGRAYAISNIHFPESADSFLEARKRLVFEELLIMQLSLFRLKGIIKTESRFKINCGDISPVLNLFPYNMTKAQQNVIAQIVRDLESGLVMNRLIQGDVGSGKTAVAMAAIYAALAGSDTPQAAFMAPTEVLAAQHYKSCKAIFDKLNIDVTLLSGSLKESEKKLVRRRIASGESRLVIGTHALIQQKVSFYDLRLVITDEQHRFGVRQRAALSDKGQVPHVVVMSATPIPRTLSLILYGDMDISVIDELPPGRTKIDTYVVNKSYRDRFYHFITKEIDNGGQAYIICPVINDNEKNDLSAVLSYSKQLAEKLPGYNVASLHGKMSSFDKNDILSRFAAGLIDILVSTTVIEVGIDVASANVIVIEDADRMGLSQLHQLRGRVGRGTKKSYCILVTDSKSKVSRERMRAMKNTSDGFELSKLDLTIRGPGEFFGTMQHGLPEMKIVNFYKDMRLLPEIQEQAAEIYNNINDQQYAPLLAETAAYTEKALRGFGL